MPATIRGHFLVAGPRLRDPNFFKSVVLVVEHNDEGAMGLVINRPSAVGSFPKSASYYDIHDMIGNVDEWTRSRVSEDSDTGQESDKRHLFNYPYDASDGREVLVGGYRVRWSLRGGAFYDYHGLARVADRYYDIGYRFNVVGFRVSVSPACSS